jgi:hypothetical protein
VDQIKTQLDQLTELSDDQVTELQSQIVSQFEAAEAEQPTPQVVDAMTALADALDSVRGEVQRREAQAEELATRAAEASARVNGMEEPEQEIAPEEMPAEEPEVSEEGAPAEETEKSMMPMGEASTDVEEGSELSTEEIEETATEIAEAPAADADTELSTEEAASDEAAVEVEEEEEAVVASAETEAPAEPSEEIAPEEQEEQAPVTASADQPFEAPADRQPVVQAVDAPVAITAGADIPGYTAGSTLTDMNEVASAMEKRIHALRRVNGGDGEQHIVASLSIAYPENRTLDSNAAENSTKISGVVGQEALVASGGFAAPLSVKYDIFGLGSTTARPVRDALPKFQADRGGIRFVVPPRIDGSAYADAVGVWTETLDNSTVYQNADYTNVKSYLVASAATEDTEVTDAVTLQIQFGNLMTRAYPELIARHNELALVQHAREAELNLISKINTGSTAVNAHNSGTDATVLGFARDFLVQVRKAAVAYRSRHRLDKGIQLKAVIPMWVHDAVASDLVLNMPGDGNLGVSASEIDGYLSESNVTFVASHDLGAFGAQSAGVLAEYPDSFSWYLFAEGTFLFLDGGTLDLGIIRDSSLTGTNDYRMFIETFEGIAKVGIESLKITSAIAINGTAAALRDTTGGATAAAIEL